MSHALKLGFLFLIHCLVSSSALPASVVEQVKSNDIGNKKVKRAHVEDETSGENSELFNPMNPTAIKRGINLKTDQLPLLTEWDRQKFRQSVPDSYPSPLYASEDELDDKTMNEYEKGFRYGTNKEKLDEALENAILKSEIYGHPAALNQYRYYGNDDNKRRRRRNIQKNHLSNRLKREVDLTPEDILALLTFWENERQQQQQQQPTFRNWHSFDPNYDLDKDEDEIDTSNEDNWMDSPVYPHISEHTAPLNPNYYYDAKPQIFEKRSHWGPYSDNKRKRFMVAKKRSDPTRELRYLNGPARNDFYTLSELLGSGGQQETNNVPLYQRYML